MANDRISRATAELVPLPPHTWYVKKISWLLEQPKVKENIRSVPLNENLMESLLEHGMLDLVVDRRELRDTLSQVMEALDPHFEPKAKKESS